MGPRLQAFSLQLPEWGGVTQGSAGGKAHVGRGVASCRATLERHHCQTRDGVAHTEMEHEGALPPRLRQRKRCVEESEPVQPAIQQASTINDAQQVSVAQAESSQPPKQLKYVIILLL